MKRRTTWYIRLIRIFEANINVHVCVSVLEVAGSWCYFSSIAVTGVCVGSTRRKAEVSRWLLRLVVVVVVVVVGRFCTVRRLMLPVVIQLFPPFNPIHSPLHWSLLVYWCKKSLVSFAGEMT